MAARGCVTSPESPPSPSLSLLLKLSLLFLLLSTVAQLRLEPVQKKDGKLTL